MKTPDVNVLLYAVNGNITQHTPAREWLEAAFAEPGGIGFSWVAVLGFIRLATKPGIFPHPLAVEDALGLVDDWLNHPHARVLNPTDRHGALLARLVIGADRAGNLTTDAHLAAIAIEHCATLGTFDDDFGRFAGLQLELMAAHAVHEPFPPNTSDCPDTSAEVIRHTKDSNNTWPKRHHSSRVAPFADE